MKKELNSSQSIQEFQKTVIACRKCPRLVRYLQGIHKTYPSYWCNPVPGFGDPKAQILLLGLAPGRFGSNRTGRMFTGDASGKFLYKALYTLGLANRPTAEDVNDGLQLVNAYITAVVRCAPPQNKPTQPEIRACIEYARQELKLLPNLKVVVALGKIAHDGYLYLLGEKQSHYPFKHGDLHLFDKKTTLIDIYHPSRQNTQTGLLTMDMFLKVLSQAKKIACNK
ncbi:MAG: uracil-DNA glycosylase [Elusimicrobia bacterium]|nr:uracil-DNA glycosylase [Elusimicrobiota bacterium]